MDGKRSKHEFRSNTLPAFVTVGPVSLLLMFLVVAPLVFVAVMSFCGTDEYYNVVYSFTKSNVSRIRIIDSAAPSGQLFALLNCLSIRLPIISVLPPPRIFETKK